MAFLVFRDTDVHGIWVRLMGWDMPVRRRLCRAHSWKTPAERASRKYAAEGCRPWPQPLPCFPACWEKTSVNYLNGTLYWRSSELVSSLFNFRKWCHNALNNNTGWFIFLWTCCPKHSASLAVFPINCKLECSSYFIMILRGGGGRLGWKRGNFRGCGGSELMAHPSCSYWDRRVLNIRTVMATGNLP